MGASLFTHGEFTLAVGDQLTLERISMQDVLFQRLKIVGVLCWEIWLNIRYGCYHIIGAYGFCTRA